MRFTANGLGDTLVGAKKPFQPPQSRTNGLLSPVQDYFLASEIHGSGVQSPGATIVAGKKGLANNLFCESCTTFYERAEVVPYDSSVESR